MKLLLTSVIGPYGVDDEYPNKYRNCLNMSQYNLDRIFRLCRVVVGAIEKARGIGNALMKNLIRLGGNRA